MDFDQHLLTEALETLGETLEARASSCEVVVIGGSSLMHASRDEFLAAARWSLTHDPSEGYRHELVALLAAFGVENANAFV